jgi:DNA repair exonuclease SbcCD ATPase subunit
MIVRSLFARNFMKYEELSIAEFPRTGVIGIIGDNESGKTTILEAITLALFGRTLKVEEQSYARLVYWKDSEMEVRLTFEIDEEVYRIWRRYDRGGGKEALLYRIVDEREELITQGLGPVNDRIEALFPINFEVCRQSFYLGQKELSHLYEKRVPNSIEMVEKMTGLDQLKRAHGQVQEKLPDLQDQLIELEKQLSIYSVKVEGLEERLVERNSIEVDLDRQKLRLEEIQTECKTQEENVEIQEQVRRTLQKLVDQFRELRATFLGNEFKRRLILNSQHFLSLYRGLKETCTQVEEEVQSLRKDVEAREKRHSLSNEVFKDLKGILYLVQDRIHQIDRNTTSQIGSENIRSYFSPETLKDREVLCEHQIKEAQESAQTLSRSYKLSLLLLCLVLVPPLLLEGANVYPWFDKITLQPMAFQVGIVLFIIPTLALLFYFLVTRSRYLRVAKEMLGKLRMLLSVLQRDLQEEAEERAKLAQFELEGVGSLEDLAEVRSMMRYEPLRKLINELIDTYEDRKALFTVGFKDALGFEQEIKKDVEILKEKRIILDQLKHLIGQYCELIEEIQAWSFTEDGDHAEIAQDFSAEFLSSSSKILRLKELLRGDYSHEKRQLDDALDAYVKLVESLCQVASEHPGLLPDIFDEKRLRWDWDSQRLVDLDLVAFLEKTRVLNDEEDYLSRLRTAWFDRFQINKESLLQEEYKVQNTEQRILFMQEAISKIEQAAMQRDQLMEEMESTRTSLETKKREQQRTGLLEQLLRGTIDSLQNRLCPNLSRFIGSILPIITDDRYSRVRVSSELEIEVYSPEKEGYLDCTSLSGGTSDQLLMCLRLAFASSLIQSTFHRGYAQFLFLDEPMYAFDSRRAVDFLERILKFNPNFQQVFLITHNRTLFGHFDQTIEATMKSHTLTC